MSKISKKTYFCGNRMVSDKELLEIGYKKQEI